jgi:hypothetical protein
MSTPQDLRTLTGFGEQLLADHRGVFRKELVERFEKILTKLEGESSKLSAEQSAVLDSFRFTGRTIIAKAAQVYPSA